MKSGQTQKRAREECASVIHEDKAKRINVSKERNIMDKLKDKGKMKEGSGQGEEVLRDTKGEVNKERDNNTSGKIPITCTGNVSSSAPLECVEETVESEMETTTLEEERSADVIRKGENETLEGEEERRKEFPSIRTQSPKENEKKARERRAKFVKMVRYKNELKYEQELSEAEKAMTTQSEKKFPRT